MQFEIGQMLPSKSDEKIFFKKTIFTNTTSQTVELSNDDCIKPPTHPPHPSRFLYRKKHYFYRWCPPPPFRETILFEWSINSFIYGRNRTTSIFIIWLDL